MGIYQWVSDLINRERQSKSSNISVSKDKLGDNNIDKRVKVIQAINTTLRRNYNGNNFTFNDKILTVYIIDPALYDSVNDTDFNKELTDSILTELGCQFDRIFVHPGPLDESQNYTTIDKDKRIFINIRTQDSKRLNGKAQIVALAGFGSTVDAEYTLNCEEIKPNAVARWNIGVGKYPKMADNGFRENHIAIDDNVQSSQFENNQFVSRAHANITYHKKKGFLLNVEIGGVTQNHKKTLIYRNERKIEIDNINIPEVLHDGDVIELSKHVRLLFHLLS